MGKEVPTTREQSFFLSNRIRTNSVLTAGKAIEIQQHYRSGLNIEEISPLTGIKADTIKKAVRQGRLLLPSPDFSGTEPTTKGLRNKIDSEQPMGKACVNTLERVLASQGGIPCPPEFKPFLDVSYGGVLLALPSLVLNGLLRYRNDFEPDKGYYSIAGVFLSLAFLALLRVKTLAQSTFIAAGELGKVIGLDRIPEVKTLRERIALFCRRANIQQWSGKLSKDWMDDYPELAGIFYIDGHVIVYFGHQTKMPKHFVTRLRLCMSGSTDYWVNDMTGQPFFVVNKTINEGMIQTITQDIIPRLDQDVPNQPNAVQLKENKYLHRYMLVFDRECYSPDFFYNLWQERIAICTYQKNVTQQWDDSEFSSYNGKLPGGEEQHIELAERGVLLQNAGSSKKIWAREIRKKTASGHQTSIITTNFSLSIILIGLYMFARWSQENFFRYMMQSFGIDTLVSYLKEKINDTTQLVNPQYRTIESKLKQLVSKVNVRKAKFATMLMGELPEKENNKKKYLEKKAELSNEIQSLEFEIEQIKAVKKAVPRKISYAQLPENEKFSNAINDRKHFLDTIKMIAYRGETAMVNLIRPTMAHADEARALLQQIYKTDANIYPDLVNKKLIVEIHSLSYRKDDKILLKLCQKLNATETEFPGTDLVLFYKMVSAYNP
jgi:hypothetical protein